MDLKARTQTMKSTPPRFDLGLRPQGDQRLMDLFQRGGLDSQTTSTVWLPTVQQLKVFGKIWQQLWVCWSILPGWIWSLWQVSGRPDAQQIPGVGNGQHRLFSIAYAAEQLKFESCCKLRCSAPMCLTSPAMPEKQKSGDPGWILDGYKLILTSLLVSMG